MPVIRIRPFLMFLRPEITGARAGISRILFSVTQFLKTVFSRKLHFFGIIREKILPSFSVNVLSTCEENLFTQFFKTVSLQNKSFTGVFEKSTHEDKMKKHDFKII